MVTLREIKQREEKIRRERETKQLLEDIDEPQQLWDEFKATGKLPKRRSKC